MVETGIFEAAFRVSPDACAVLDADGTIVAVNDAWSAFAPSAPSPATTGIGVDYAAVCRRGAALGAPRAEEANAALTAVLSGRQTSASVVYPCTVPSGVRWFRAETFAVGPRGPVAARHVDVSDRFAGGATEELFGDVLPAMTEAGLLLALQDALDGPPAPAVVLLVVDLGAAGGNRSPAGAESARAGVVDRIRESRSGIDVLARVGPSTVAVLVTAPDHDGAMIVADAVVHAVPPPSSGAGLQWGVATGAAPDSAPAVLARAQRSLLTSTARRMGGTADIGVVHRSARLDRAADALAVAVDDFDRALARGAVMTDLARFDRAVQQAEQEWLAAIDAAHPGR